MSRRAQHAEREWQTRLEDLENALRTIGQIAVDGSVTPKSRLQRILGIVSLYECAPVPDRMINHVLPLEVETGTVDGGWDVSEVEGVK